MGFENFFKKNKQEETDVLEMPEEIKNNQGIEKTEVTKELANEAMKQNSETDKKISKELETADMQVRVNYYEAELKVLAQKRSKLLRESEELSIPKGGVINQKEIDLVERDIRATYDEENKIKDTLRELREKARALGI